MQIAILEMPAENVWGVKVDDLRIPGHLKKNPRNEDRWQVFYPKDGVATQLRTEPWSVQGAACLLLFHHFEGERKRLRELEAEEAERQRAREARKSADKTAGEETSGDS